MNDELVDVRTPLAVGANARIEVGLDGQVHVVTEHVTLHLERNDYQELTNTMARAMVRLYKLETQRERAKPQLRVLSGASDRDE